MNSSDIDRTVRFTRAYAPTFTIGDTFSVRMRPWGERHARRVALRVDAITYAPGVVRINVGESGTAYGHVATLEYPLGTGTVLTLDKLADDIRR